MNKISLLSLLTVMAISTGAKANVENPLYMPKEGVGYSKTGFTTADEFWRLSEKVGYGFTNNFAASIGLDYYTVDSTDENGLGNLELDLEYRMSSGSMISDLYVGMKTNMDDKIFDDHTTYEAGLRFGVMKKDWTLAANVGYEYEDLTTLDETASNIIIGADVVHEFNNAWSAQVGLEYKMLDDLYETLYEDDLLTLTLQANYENNGLWSVYYETELNNDHKGTIYEDQYGVKYGVQF